MSSTAASEPEPRAADKARGADAGTAPPASPHAGAGAAASSPPRNTGTSDADSDVDFVKGSNSVDRNIYIAKSVRLQWLNWWHVASIYVPFVVYIGFAAVVVQFVLDLRARGVDLQRVSAATAPAVTAATEWASEGGNRLMLGAFLVVVVAFLRMRRERGVYLVDFSVFKPPADWLMTHDQLVECMGRTDAFSEDHLEFMRRILSKSETGQATAWPPGTTQLLKGKPTADTTMAAAREEAAFVIFGTIRDLMKKTGVKARDIDFLIINCSLFSPTPSLCAMVSNEFQLRGDCRTYNLSGMGCSAGVISIDLAKQLLANKPNSLCVVVSTENLTQQLYLGGEKSMLLQNTLFRCGGAAMLLSSRQLDGFRAKYKLLHTVRTQNASRDAYECVYETQDSKGHRGIRLSKDVTKIAGRALATNLTLLGPHVLPLREQAKVVGTEVVRRTHRWLRRLAKARDIKFLLAWLDARPEVKSYVPDFKRGIHHFCIHAGGRAVIDGIEKNLNLSPEDTEPSRQTLRDYGNTSSSSIWYELDFIERAGRISSGDRVLQIAFGSGFKCNSAVWLRMKGQK